MPKKKKIAHYPPPPEEQINPLDGIVLHEEILSSREDREVSEVSEVQTGLPIKKEISSSQTSPPSRPSREISSSTSDLHLVYENAAHGIWLYQNNCLTVLDAIAQKYPEGRFDCIFADPPYFLSNGGISCHAGRMVKVDKGDWDKSQGPEINHEFNRAWLERCQRVLKPNGTIWVTGTHHVIFSVGYAMQQLGFKILNDIAWEKPNPPPNLSCRYFTHSTETIIWAAKNEKSKHTFNYAAMKAVTGKQMKTVWTMTAPGRDEKQHGKHPTQKPVALIERCLLASTHEGAFVLDPFTGAGTTAVACIRIGRNFLGIEMEGSHFALARTRADYETVLLWLRTFRVEMRITVMGRARRSARAVSDPLAPIGGEGWGEGAAHETRNAQHFSQIDLDLPARSMDRIKWMEDTPPKTDCIFHEVKFVFLSCAQVSDSSVVHTTVDVNLQEAWAKTPNGKKRETTHVVRCETEILRIKKT